MKKEIKVRQHDNTDCAAACVASVCAHYGLRLPLLRIREACGTGPDGTSLQGIIDACGRLGMDAAGLCAKEKHITDLQEAVKPVILHLRKRTDGCIMWSSMPLTTARRRSWTPRTERFTG